MSVWLIALALALSALPAAMTVANLRALARPPLPKGRTLLAILIPARNEEGAIGACVEAALASVGADIEVIVQDDGSIDRTAAIVQELSRRDDRVRLVPAPP